MGLALFGIGAIVGAVAFSLTVGRRRAHRLAQTADGLARVAEGNGGRQRFRYPDRQLRASFERLAERIAEVEALASTDPLTRLLNRQACLAALQAEIGRANRHGHPLAVALVDIDHFKRVNDTHGHEVGDEVLRQVAQLLRDSIRASDTIGRYGGEEFLLVMPETDLEGGLASAEHARRQVGRAKISVGDSGIAVTISIGVSGGRGAGPLQIDRMLREADSALYSAKALGRDQLQAFRPVDEESSVMGAAIGAGARNQATRLGKAAFDASSRHLLDVVSTRAGWAGGASALIAAIAGDVAMAIALPDADVDRIRTASLLHDLGKLAIPDRILSKPAALNAAEWRTIIEHPKIGQVVLEQAGAIRDAAAIVLHHHEWYDGRGYPYGLAGAEIPIGSRIVSVADAYEAMISERPYKQALSHEQALAELQRGSGSQFDPELVEIFLSLFGARAGRRPGDGFASGLRRH